MRQSESESVAIGLLYIEWLASQGLVEAAYQASDKLAARWPSVPAALDDLQWRAASTARADARLAALQNVLAVAGDVDAYRSELVSLHLQRGESDAALKVQ